MNLAWYFAFFAVSGFCTLVYEVVWLRSAMAKFGVTTPMVSIVLSVFMAGLGLGSWIGGLVVGRSKSWSPVRPLRLYGLAELLIGISGLLVPQLFEFGYEQNRSGGSELRWDSGAYYLASGGWIAISLLPWCTAMGATFPLAMAAIRSTARDFSDRSFSYLYRANVLGAILGTLVPALLLIEQLGFRKTLYIASSLNLILAASVFFFSFRLVRSSAPIARPPARADHASVPDTDRARGILWLLFLTGLCTMAMEVVWIRQFTVFLGNVVYSFAVILASYLAATWTGSYFYHRRAGTHESQDGAAAWNMLGLLALLPLAFADPTLPVPREWKWAVFRTACAIGPLSAALGFLTPFLVDRFSAGDPDRAGRAYGVNIVGGIFGPLCSGFVILPWLGDRHALVALSLPLFAIGLAAATRKPSVRNPATIVPGGGGGKVPYWVTICLAILLVAFTNNYEGLLTRRVEFRDYMATVIAAEHNGRKLLLMNGVGMTSLTPVTKYMAHLPLASLSRPPRRALVICFGMGTTFRSMLSWGIDTTVVELNPSVPRLFSYFHKDAPELVRLPRAHIVIDDGRRFLEHAATHQYDVITMDPPPPISTPTTSLLYSREFYDAAKQHLTPGGILQAWLPIRDSGWDLTTQTAFAKALRDSFRYVRVFPCLGGWGLHMLASEFPISIRNAEELTEQMPPAAAADLVEWNPGATPQEMFDALLRVEQSIDDIAPTDAAVPPIQDDRPINEYFFLRRLSGP